MTKNFLIVNDEHPKTVCKELEKKALQFVAETFGKDKLARVQAEADGLDGGEFMVELIFTDYTHSEEDFIEPESMHLVFEDKYVQVFKTKNGQKVRRKVLYNFRGVPFRNNKRDVYGVSAMGVYEAFKDYMLTY